MKFVLKMAGFMQNDISLCNNSNRDEQKYQYMVAPD
jgi:hypothetical protein